MWASGKEIQSIGNSYGQGGLHICARKLSQGRVGGGMVGGWWMLPTHYRDVLE